MTHNSQPRIVTLATRAAVVTMLALIGTLLSGCKDESASAQDKASLDKHNAEIARKNEVRNQIK